MLRVDLGAAAVERDGNLDVIVGPDAGDRDGGARRPAGEVERRRPGRHVGQGELTRAIGLVLIIAGVPGVVDSFARFALQGLGTPAPIAPTQKLVVTGLYRYVRNPIYVGVAAVIFGQAILFGDWRLLWYAALLWLSFHVFVLVYEEPTLKQTFGAQYEDFRANVPRWVPRLTPWRVP